MKIDCSATQFGALLSCYPVGFSQEITDRVMRLDRRDAQLLDIKELNDLAAEYRARIRGLIKAYRGSKSSARQECSVRSVYRCSEPSWFYNSRNDFFGGIFDYL